MKTEATLLNNEKSFIIWLTKKWIRRKRYQERQAEDGEWDLDHCDEEDKEERETKQGTKKKERGNGNKRKRDRCGQANGVGTAGKPPITERSRLVPEEHE